MVGDDLRWSKKRACARSTTEYSASCDLSIWRFSMRLMPIACILMTSSLVAQEAKPARDLYDDDRSAERRHVLVVPAGTKVPLVLKQGISTKNARVGDPVFAVTSFPVAIND